MNRYVLGLIALLSVAGCRPDENPISPEEPPVRWQKRTDVILNNKVLLGAHANAQRLIVAFAGGFLQMEAADTSFIKRNSAGGGTQYLLGGRLSPSLFKPLLTDRLYVGVSSERDAIAIADVFNTVDSTYRFLPYYLNIREATGIPEAQVHTYMGGPLFGAYNARTRTLLFMLESNRQSKRWTAVVNKTDDTPHFAFRRTNTPFRTDTVGRFGFRGAIAVDDYFIVSPDVSMLVNDTYLYAVDALRGTLRKIPVDFIPPDRFFFFRGRLYGYESTFGKLVRSDNGGLTWREVAAFTGGGFNFAEIDGQLIAYGQSQLFWLGEGDNPLSGVRELTTNGLDFSQITGVAAFGEKVFLTTLSGLYAIDKQKFFTVSDGK